MAEAEARESAATVLLELTASNLPKPTTSVSDAIVQTDLTIYDI